MKFSVLFKSLDAARTARRQLMRAGLLRWNDLTSLHHRRIRVDALPLPHTSARRGAVVGGVAVGLVAAVILAAVAASNQLGFGIGLALALGAGAGILYGGVFGAIAYSTRPAEFIRSKERDVRHGGALIVCDIPDADRAERVRDELEQSAEVLAA